ncbi:MAG: FG-GAP-like repeat-containing protein [Isosphaeraceae bacterium]
MNLEVLEDRLAPARFSVSGDVLNLVLDDNERLGVVSKGTSYALALSGGSTWSGTNNANVTGNGSATLTVTAAGIGTFTSGIVINDNDATTGGTAVAFNDSGTYAYSNPFNVILNRSSTGASTPGLSFTGRSTFAGAAGLNASASGDVVINAGAGVTSNGGLVRIVTTGANSAMTVDGAVVNADAEVLLRATGSLTVGALATVNSGAGPLTLASDLRSDGASDDGNGALTVNGALHGASVSLRGADMNIGAAALIGKATASGPVLSTFVGSGQGLSAPNNLAFDAAGNLYIANRAANNIRKVTPTGVVSTFASGLNGPAALAFDAAGNLYVANAANNTVSKVTPAGVVSTIISSGLNLPQGLIIDSAGNLYVANSNVGTLLKYTLSGTSLGTFASGISGVNQGLAFDTAGNLYATAYNANTVVKITPAGVKSDFVTSDKGLMNPTGMTIDTAGNLYVSNSSNNTISKVSPAGVVSTFTTGVNIPVGAAFDAAGNLYVSNFGSNTVSKFTPNLVATNSVTVRSSMPGRPMHLGGADNSAVSGINLTTAELARVVTSATGTVTIGDASQTGDLVFAGARPASTAGAATVVAQSVAGQGRILLDGSMGTALDGNGGRVTLNPGGGGLDMSPSATAPAIVTAGFTAEGPLGLELGFAPTVGQQITLIRNSGAPIVGGFDNLPAGGTVVLDYLGVPYSFDVSYAGGTGADLVLTALGASNAAVSSIARAGGPLTNSESVDFTVTFSRAVTGLSASNFTVVADPRIRGAAVTGVAGGGTSWTVTVATGAGEGPLGLNLTNSAGVADASGGGLANLPFAGPSYTVDKTPPAALAISTVGRGVTAAASVDYLVRFSEAVTGVNAGNFSLVADLGIDGAAVTGVSGGGTTWTVTVATGSGDGDLRLDLVDGTGIRDAAGNPLAATPARGQTYTIDKTSATVTAINPTGPRVTNSSAVTFSVTFNSMVTGVAPRHFSLIQGGGLAGASITRVSGIGSNWTVTADTGVGSGTLGLSMTDAAGVTDSVGNSLTGIPFTGSQAFTIDKTAPTVASINRVGAATTGAAAVDFAVTFSEPVIGLTPRNFAVAAGAGVAGASVAAVSGGGASWTVTVNTGAGDGTLGLDLVDASAVRDAAGNALGGVPFSGQSYTLSRAPWVVGITTTGPTVLTARSVTYNVTFSEPVTGVTANNFTLAAAGGVSGARITGASGAGASWAVTVDTGLGDGTLGLDLTNATGIKDSSNNPLTGVPFRGQIYTLVSTGPELTSIRTDTSSMTTADIVSYVVGFSRPVTGVTAANFALAAGAGMTGTAITGVSGSGASWTVTAATGTGDGPLRLDLVNNRGIVDASGNPLETLDFTGASYYVNKSGPTNPIDLVGPSLTNGEGGVQFLVTFSTAVTGVDLTDFRLALSRGLSATLTGITRNDASSYTVNVGGVTAAGTINYSLGLNLVNNGSIRDLAGNVLTPTINPTFVNAGTFPSGVNVDRVAVGDLNGDGRPDVVTANLGGATVQTDLQGIGVLLSNADGSLGEVRLLDTNFNVNSVALADVNRDGRLDVIAANSGKFSGESSHTVDVFLGNGNGTFQTRRTNAIGLRMKSVMAADVNGDGKVDILGVTANENAIKVLLGNGDGSFQPYRSFTAGPVTVGFTVADVNRDGRLDVIVANQASSFIPAAGVLSDFAALSGTVGVMLGNGDGTFRQQTTYANASNYPSAVATADLNRDGNPDIVVAIRDQIGVLLGNGDGTFQAQVNYAGNSGLQLAVTTADMNGDGKVDVIVTGENNSVKLLKGNGDGTLQAPEAIDTGANATHVAVAPMFGGGIPVLVVARSAVETPGSIPLGAVTLLAPGDRGPTYTIDQRRPVARSLNRIGLPTTNAETVDYSLSFDEPVLSVSPANFSVTTTGNLTGAHVSGVSGSGRDWVVTVNTGSGDGDLSLRLSNFTGIKDAAGNTTSGPALTGQPFTILKSTPVLISLEPVGPSITGASTVDFTATFSSPVTESTCRTSGCTTSRTQAPRGTRSPR